MHTVIVTKERHEGSPAIVGEKDCVFFRHSKSSLKSLPIDVLFIEEGVDEDTKSIAIAHTMGCRNPKIYSFKRIDNAN